jgi:hypothetical protein
MPNLTVADGSLVAGQASAFQQQTEFLRARLLQAQARMKSQADKHRSERQFPVGEQVLLKLQPYAQKLVVNRQFPKLSYKYFGPYQVLERIGAVAYKLHLPASSQVYPLFHVSQLKPFTVNYSPVYDELPSAPDLAASATWPEVILDRRLVCDGHAANVQVLIKWSSLSRDEATWEDYNLLKTRFPDAAL